MNLSTKESCNTCPSPAGPTQPSDGISQSKASHTVQNLMQHMFLMCRRLQSKEEGPEWTSHSHSQVVHVVVQAGERCQLVLAANKQDLQHRSVSEEEAQEFAASQGAAYFQTSAKTGLGLEELFSTLLSSVLDSLKDQRQHAAQGRRSTGSFAVPWMRALLVLW